MDCYTSYLVEGNKNSCFRPSVVSQVDSCVLNVFTRKYSQGVIQCRRRYSGNALVTWGSFNHLLIHDIQNGSQRLIICEVRNSISELALSDVTYLVFVNRSWRPLDAITTVSAVQLYNFEQE